MTLRIPEMSLVVLIGASGSGKSTFARRHFVPGEVVSSDACRVMVANDETDQSATPAAFELVHFLIRKRLERGLLTVVDATNVQPEARRSLVQLAREYHVLPVAIVFKIAESVCQERNRGRENRDFGPHVVRRQTRDMFRSLGALRKEGFRHQFFLTSPDEVDTATIVREPLWNNRKGETGPFDIVGDVHGCLGELHTLLEGLGYQIDGDSVTPPEGRRAIFLGDLVDRGPDSPGVLKLVMGMVRAGTALAVPGNHDIKLMRHLKGVEVKIAHGLQETLDQLKHATPEFLAETVQFLDGLVSHYVLDGGRLVVAHAGLKEGLQGRGSAAVREFALYGETTGEIDEFGLPVRHRWAEDYRGKALVVFGHTPVPDPDWLNNTVCIDTGCVFGGHLTAYRYPEGEIVSVPAARVYCEPIRPLRAAETGLSSQQRSDDLLDIADVRGRQHILVQDWGTIVIPEEQATAALEVMGRFAADPKWLAYLPPTMSPPETSARPGTLEHPEEAFGYFAEEGVEEVIAEEKHMGSRAVVCLGRDTGAVLRRFGVVDRMGTILTRTGRPFFSDDALEQAFLGRLAVAMVQANLWTELSSDWVILDAELMPWSAKAQDLLRRQYAPLGAAAIPSVHAAHEWMVQAASRIEGLDSEVQALAERRLAVTRYVDAYRRYCWPIHSLEDYKLAPFHIVASEGQVHLRQSHRWHMDLLSRLVREDQGILRTTRTVILDPRDGDAVAQGTAWWEELTGDGGEGMVVKPIGFTTMRGSKMVQPALKCRGREYLRIIYGPEYDLPANLERLRKRGLARKRSLALREFALGMEGLRRFVAGEPLRRVHQCAFGVLALESEAVDMRL